MNVETKRKINWLKTLNRDNEVMFFESIVRRKNNRFNNIEQWTNVLNYPKNQAIAAKELEDVERNVKEGHEIHLALLPWVKAWMSQNGLALTSGVIRQKRHNQGKQKRPILVSVDTHATLTKLMSVYKVGSIEDVIIFAIGKNAKNIKEIA